MSKPSEGLDRVTFEISRASEYFNARELQAQTGQERENFATVVLKELVDNALDAGEAAGAPRGVVEGTGGPTEGPDPVRLLPNWVKQCATGDPGADKQLVRRFVSGLFPRFATGDPVPWKHLGDDATDAAAIAYAGVDHAEATAVGWAA